MTALSTSHIITVLDDWGRRWPDHLMLHTTGSGDLMLVRKTDGRILWTSTGIDVDGGDPDITVDADGNEYLAIYARFE